MNKEKAKIIVLWTSIFTISLGILGMIIAVFWVLFFQQSTNGKYAITNECVLYNEECLKGCEDEAATRDPIQGGINCDCCLKTEEFSTPLGKYIKEQALMLGKVGILFGLVFGSLYGEQKYLKSKEQ